MSARSNAIRKLAANYLAFVELASLRIWLRANESTPKSSCRRGARSSSPPALDAVPNGGFFAPAEVRFE